MTKKILISISVIGVVAALAIGATVAFFNDTETSEGNIFTAGSIDLKVDHYSAVYNNDECEGYCEPIGDNLVSNGSFEEPVVTHSAEWDIFQDGYTGLEWAVEWEGGSTSYGGETRPDPALQELHSGVLGSAYEGDQYAELDTDWDGPDGSLNNEPASVKIWQDVATIPGETYQISFAFSPRPNTSSAENQLEVRWDGSVVDTVSETGGGSINWSVKTYVVSATASTTKIEFTDKGTANSLGTFLDDVSVQLMDCNYQIDGGECELWEEKNIEDEFFFHFDDVKPGDFGRNVISLHVFNNNAWSCLIVHDVQEEENNRMEPEIEAGDTTENEGELGDYLMGFAWNDKDQDGLYDPGDGEGTYGVPDSFFDVFYSIPLHDSQSGNGYLPASTTEYVGLAWCAGQLSVDNTTGEITCDGSTMLDDAQSDSLIASLTAYAEQVRNNPNFKCSEVELE